MTTGSRTTIKMHAAALIAAAAFAASSATAAPAQSCRGPASRSALPLDLKDLGSLMYGGTVDRTAAGETVHVDHGYAQYLIPRDARNLPIVMWHGYGQSGKTWETTPDGRNGFEQIFASRSWPVYVVDQPRRGRAGKSSGDGSDLTHKGSSTESALWTNFRLGEWYPPAQPKWFPCLQFDHSPAVVDQFLRQQTPNTGPEPFPSAEGRQFQARQMTALLHRTGPAILFTHSHSGQYGWATAMMSPDLVKAIVAFEPGEYAFPEGEEPPAIETPVATLRTYMAPQVYPMSEFAKLTRMPIVIYLGDNMSNTPSADYGEDLWRIVRQRARQFVAAVNRHGGDAKLVELPSVGLRGNTHFMMSDLNNVAVADQVSSFLREKGLDGRRGADAGANSPPARR